MARASLLPRQVKQNEETPLNKKEGSFRKEDEAGREGSTVEAKTSV